MTFQRHLAIALSLVAIAVWGPIFASAFQPPAGTYADFRQEWLSARNYWTGHPVYESQHVSFERHTGLQADQLVLAGIDEPAHWKWNTHPPVSLLAALPSGLFTNYRDAHLFWNLATFPGYLLALAVLAWNLRIPIRVDTIVVAVALTVSSYPLFLQLQMGQLNLLILPLLALGWSADRRGHASAAGLFFGLATTLKLFPAFIFVYLLFSGRWRALIAAALTVIALDGVAWVVFGTEAFAAYLRDVLPSVRVAYAFLRNASITGFWSRLFGISSSTTTACVAATFLLIFIIVVRLAWSARRCNVAASDRAFATTLIAMLLLSPVTWSHYFVLLLPSIVILWDRLERTWERCAFYLAVVVLWAREGIFADLFFEHGYTKWISSGGNARTVNPLLISLHTYSLLILFALAALGRWREDRIDYPHHTLTVTSCAKEAS